MYAKGRSAIDSLQFPNFPTKKERKIYLINSKPFLVVITLSMDLLFLSFVEQYSRKWEIVWCDYGNSKPFIFLSVPLFYGKPVGGEERFGIDSQK